MRFSSIIYSIIILITVSACTEKFDNVKLVSNQDKLVIESFVNTQDTFSVRVTKTIEFGADVEDIAVSNLNIMIVENENDTISLVETSQGNYTFNKYGVIGSSYYIIIENDDKVYASSPTVLEAPSILEATTIKEFPNETGNGFYAFSCFADDSTTQDYYLKSYNVYSKATVNTIDSSKTIYYVEAFTDEFSNGFNTCEDDIEMDSVNIFSQVNSVPFSSEDTLMVFSLYRMNRFAYEYWSQFIEQTQFIGGPFDVPPSPIIGNIRNINDENDYLLGYFMVAGMDRVTVEISENYRL